MMLYLFKDSVKLSFFVFGKKVGGRGIHLYDSEEVFEIDNSNIELRATDKKDITVHTALIGAESVNLNVNNSNLVVRGVLAIAADISNSDLNTLTIMVKHDVTLKNNNIIINYDSRFVDGDGFGLSGSSISIDGDNILINSDNIGLFTTNFKMLDGILDVTADVIPIVIISENFPYISDNLVEIVEGVVKKCFVF